MRNINAFFWLLIFAHAANAEGEFIDVSLEELMDVKITSITKMPMPINKSPISAYVISQDEISRKGYRFLTDILKNTPGFFVTNLGPSEKDISQIYINGVFANDKIVVLIDGVKVKAPTGEPTTFFNSMPLIDVKQIEISIGSVSSIYGADAMLGAINLVTETGAGIDGFKMKATGGTRDTGEVQVAAGKKINDDISVSLAGSFKHSAQEDLKQNYPEIYGKFDNIDLTEQNNNVHFKANYKDLTVSYYRLQNISNNSLSFNPNPPFSYDYSGKAFWNLTNQVANATYNLDINPFWQAKSSLSYESNELSDDSSYRSWGVVAPISWFGDAMRLSETLAYLKGDINWLTGIELSFMDSQPKNQYTDMRTPKYRLNYQNYAIYSQLNYDVTESLALNGSLRMDVNSLFDPDFNPRLGFSWQAMKELRFFGAWGTSFLAPSPYLMYETWNMPSDLVYSRPNTNLKPEHLMTAELGFNLEPFKNNTLKLSGFYTHGTDIVRIVDNAFTGKPNYNANLATLTTQGFQISEKQTFDFGLTADVDYTFTTGEQDSQALNRIVGMTNSPEHMIKSSLLYNFDKFTARFTGRWFDRIRAHESNSTYKGRTMHGATIFDANLHYVLPLKSAEWSVDLGVTNLLDTKYYAIDVNDSFSAELPHLPQETRRLYFSVGLSF